MTERVEEIRQQYDAHFVNGGHEDCGWRFGCATVRDLLTALAQAERERDDAKVEWAHWQAECETARAEVEEAQSYIEGFKRSIVRVSDENIELRAEVERLKRELAGAHDTYIPVLEDLARVRAALAKLLGELSDVQIEAVREGCGNTNAACLRQRVDEARAALEGRSSE